MKDPVGLKQAKEKAREQRPCAFQGCSQPGEPQRVAGNGGQQWVVFFCNKHFQLLQNNEVIRLSRAKGTKTKTD
jgi:hypothetical protein